MLANNAGNDLTVTGNGGFTFPNHLGGGAAYAVTIQSQPVNPSQICAVTNGTGTVSTVNVNSVVVSCTTNFYTVGGVVSGLSGSGLVLQANGGNNLAVTGSGPYTLATLASGSNYTVTVMTQPINPSQTCTVANDAGVIGGANVTNVAITCATNSYTIGGAVTGLAGSGLVVQTNGANNVSVSASGTYTLATLPSGSAFNVTILSQPTNPSQTCVVSDGSGTVTSANFGLVSISCARSHAVGRYAFVSDYNADTVTALAIDSITGNLAVINSAPSDVNPYAIAVTPNGAFVYTANSGAADISIFAVNATTGAVTAAGTASTGVGSAPYGITVDPSGLFVLAADSAGGTLVVFQINQTTGALTQVAGSPFATAPAPGANPSSVTVDPSDQFVYATNQFNPTLGLAGYTFNPAPGSGDLTQLATWQLATGNAGLGNRRSAGSIRLRIEQSGRHRWRLDSRGWRCLDTDHRVAVCRLWRRCPTRSHRDRSDRSVSVRHGPHQQPGCCVQHRPEHRRAHGHGRLTVCRWQRRVRRSHRPIRAVHVRRQQLRQYHLNVHSQCCQRKFDSGSRVAANLRWHRPQCDRDRIAATPRGALPRAGSMPVTT